MQYHRWPGKLRPVFQLKIIANIAEISELLDRKYPTNRLDAMSFSKQIVDEIADCKLKTIYWTKTVDYLTNQ